MFNTSVTVGGNTQSVTFNSPCTGILQKSSPLSKFIRFQKGSVLEKWIFPVDGGKSSIEKEEITESDRYYGNITKTIKINICILQILIFGDNCYLCEYIKDI